MLLQSEGAAPLRPGSRVTVVLSKFAGSLYPSQVGAVLENLRGPFQLEVRDPRETRSPDQIFADPLPEGTRLVVVIGGDGTVNRVLNWSELLRPLLIVPAGTANDLARNLGIPVDFEKAAELIRSGRRRKMDLISVNGVRFCTAGGLGVPADCALQLSRFRRSSLARVRAVDRLGPAAYRLAALLTILTGRLRVGTIHLDLAAEGGRRERTLQTSGLLAANQGRIAGRLLFSPSSVDDDGRFELTLFHANRRGDLLKILRRFSSQEPVSPEDLEIVSVSEAHLSCDQPRRFFGDGELLCQGRDFHLTLEKRALEVFAPA